MSASTVSTAVKALALASPTICQWTDGKQIVKVICVLCKMISVVVKEERHTPDLTSQAVSRYT